MTVWHGFRDDQDFVKIIKYSMVSGRVIQDIQVSSFIQRDTSLNVPNPCQLISQSTPANAQRDLGLSLSNGILSIHPQAAWLTHRTYSFFYTYKQQGSCSMYIQDGNFYKMR